MKTEKHICDLCKNDLRVRKHASIAPGVEDPFLYWFDYYVFHRRRKIVKQSYSSLFTASILMNPWSKQKIEVCSICMDDFEEFVARKQVCKR